MPEPTGDSALPPFVVDYDTNWVSVGLNGDLDAWSADAAREVLARDGRSASKKDVRRLADHFAAAGAVATRVPDSMATFLLCPAPERRVLTVVRMVAVELSDEDVAAGVETAQRIVAPDDLPAIEPPELTTVDTPAGPAARSLARVARAGGGDHEVHEWLNYAWVVPGYRFAVVLTTAFADLVEAGRWRPAVDALAGGVAMAEGRA